MIRAWITILFLSACEFCVAQKRDDEYANEKENPAPQNESKINKDRWVLGGNFGGFIGEVSFVQISPMLGYKLTEKLTSGVGLNYILAASNDLNMNVVGGSIWSRYKISPTVFLHSEFEQLQINARATGYQPYRASAPVFMIGGGYLQGNFGVTVLYDVIQDADSPYQTPIIRIGGLFNLR